MLTLTCVLSRSYFPSNSNRIGGTFIGHTITIAPLYLSKPYQLPMSERE